MEYFVYLCTKFNVKQRIYYGQSNYYVAEQATY